jgi:hypothetical protein
MIEKLLASDRLVDNFSDYYYCFFKLICLMLDNIHTMWVNDA